VSNQKEFSKLFLLLTGDATIKKKGKKEKRGRGGGRREPVQPSYFKHTTIEVGRGKGGREKKERDNKQQTEIRPLISYN